MKKFIGILLLCLVIAVFLVVGAWTLNDKASLYSRDALDVVIYPSDILREVAQPVAVVGEEERQLAVLLQNTMARLDLTGLSSAEVGVSKRIIVINIGQSVVMINPEILDRSGSITGLEECPSLPQEDYTIQVTRSERVTVRYMTLEGEESIMEATGQDARIIQHELDHLNGILIIDYPARPKMTNSLLAAIIVYSVALLGAVFIYFWNRRKGKVSQ